MGNCVRDLEHGPFVDQGEGSRDKEMRMLRRLGLLIAGLLIVGGVLPAHAATDAAAAELVRGSAAGFERPADVPWLLVAALIGAAIVTLRAGLSAQPRAVRVSIRPPKQR